MQIPLNRWRAVLGAALVTGLFAGCASEPPDSLTGTMEVFVTTFDDGRAQLHHELVLPDRRVELEFQEAPELPSGLEVRVEGYWQGPRYLVETIEVLTDDDDGVAVVSSALIGAGVKQQTKLLALMVHWSAPNTMTADVLKQKLFTNTNSTAAFYGENSFATFNMTGDVFGWYQIAAPTGCDTAAIGSAARAAATAAGIDVASYKQVLYYFPSTSACSWSGLAYLGGPARPARDSFYNGSSGCVVLAQELLHNFGAQHSRSYKCTGSPIAAAANCTSSEYGDPFDPMGGGCYHVNAYQKAAQGWFGGCNNVTATANGTFAIVPTETASNAIQSLRIPMAASLCPSGMTSCYYLVEYRQPLGVIEGGYSSTASVFNGVLIHVAPAVSFAGTGTSPLKSPYLLDMKQSTTTFSDAALAVGQTFTDPNGVSIKLASRTSASAVVEVSFTGGGSGAPLCIDGSVYGAPPPTPDTTSPSVTQVSPADGATAAPNSTVTVVATVTDNVAVSKAEMIWTNGTNSWTVDCDAAASPFSCTTSGTTRTWTVTVGSSGSRTWAVRGTDPSGNVTTSPTRTIVIGSTPPADTTKPTVTLSSPANGASVALNSTLTLVATVSDNVAVSRAELLWTSGSTTSTIDCASAAAPFSCTTSGTTRTWSVAASAVGTYSWAVRGTDTSNNVTTSGTRTLQVTSAPPPDTTKPTVTLDSPADGATAARNSTVTVVATVTDDVAVSKAELIWKNGTNSWTVNCASASSPFSCTTSGNTRTWRVTVGSAGTRTWSVRGTDTSGNVTTSATRSLQVL